MEVNESRGSSLKTEVKTLKTYDGYEFKIKLSYPESKFDKLVIYINGAGPNTYDNTRLFMDNIKFNYHDLFRNELAKIGVAYCSYNTRGVDVDSNPPWFNKIDENVYDTYTPNNIARDIEVIVKYLKGESKFKNIKIYLLGWNEGSIIAPIVAKNGNVKIDGLLLVGYYHENFKDVLKWQLSGNSLLINWLRAFDVFNKGYITKEDFLADKFKVKDQVFMGKTFEEIDLNRDGKIDIEDTKPLTYPYYLDLIKAINEGNDEWLVENYPIQLSSIWFKEHFKLSATKNILSKLNIPIYMFQGELDSNTNVQDVIAIMNDFEKLGKKNLNVKIFNGHDHELNYIEYIVSKQIPEGIKDIINTIKVV